MRYQALAAESESLANTGETFDEPLAICRIHFRHVAYTVIAVGGAAAGCRWNILS